MRNQCWTAVQGIPAAAGPWCMGVQHLCLTASFGYSLYTRVPTRGYPIPVGPYDTIRPVTGAHPCIGPHGSWKSSDLREDIQPWYYTTPSLTYNPGISYRFQCFWILPQEFLGYSQLPVPYGPSDSDLPYTCSNLWNYSQLDTRAVYRYILRVFH